MQKLANTNNSNSTKVQFYYPATKIRSLIQNLDEELKRLTKKCALDKLETFNQQQEEHLRNLQNANQLNLRLNYNFQTYNVMTNHHTMPKPDSGVHMRTLASVYRQRVIDAYRNRRIFTVYGNYYTIRRALLKRGWLEKLTPSRYLKLQNLSEDSLLQNAKRGNEYEAVLLSRIANHFPAFFIWQNKGMRDMYEDVRPYRNRVRRCAPLDFSTKVGLIGCAEHEHWYTQDGVCRMSYPRFYRLRANSEERSAFVEDFRRTQCRCLIRYVWENMTNTTALVDTENGSIDAEILTFALNNLKQHLIELEMVESSEPKITIDNELEKWQNFLLKSNEILKQHAKLRATLSEVMEAAREGRVLLDKIEAKRPDYKWDGCRNLWILKPGFSCRGIGIIIRSCLEDIVQWVSNNSGRSYIAQKYIERPLLVYKTKFDIRQYMLLVVGETTVSVWLYRDCYLRFSSQEFSMDDLRESIHLTNNSVQKKYKSKPTRDPRLPRHNMWSLEQFQTYLKQCEAPNDVWQQRVFKGFKENLVAVVMASLEETKLTENAFELYGCDFMLDEHYNPILIEINSTPDLSPSTEVTSRICPMVLRDVVKVVVDRPLNTNADMGLFELVYEVNYKTQENFDPNVGLPVQGHSMKLVTPKKGFNDFWKRNFRGRIKKGITEPEAGVQIIKLESNNAAKTSPRGHRTVKKAAAATSKKTKPTNANTETTAKIPKSPPVQMKVTGEKLQPITKEALAIRYTLPK